MLTESHLPARTKSYHAFEEYPQAETANNGVQLNGKQRVKGGVKAGIGMPEGILDVRSKAR